MENNGFKGSPNTKGRPRGAKNRTTTQTKAIIQKIVNDEIDTLPEMLDKLKPKERIEAVIKLMAYLIPKQSQIQIDLPPERFQPVIIQMHDPLKLEDETN